MKPGAYGQEVVLVGRQQIPGRLAHQFLLSADILPAEYDWQVVAEVPSPLLARLSYANGIDIAVSPDRCAIVYGAFADRALAAEQRDALLGELASRYVAAFPQVQFTAVGLNLDMIMDQAREVVWSWLLCRADAWDFGGSPTLARQLRQQCRIDNALLTVAIVDVRAEYPGQAVERVRVSANCHHELKETLTVDSLSGLLVRFPDYRKKLESWFEEVTGV
jgi:hypothetical protein